MSKPVGKKRDRLIRRRRNGRRERGGKGLIRPPVSLSGDKRQFKQKGRQTMQCQDIQLHHLASAVHSGLWLGAAWEAVNVNPIK